MSRSDDDLDWMTARARALMAKGLSEDDAVAQALEDGKARIGRVKSQSKIRTADLGGLAKKLRK